VAEEAVQVAQAMDAIQVYREKLTEQLQSLSYYTHEPYDAQTVALADLKESDMSIPKQPHALAQSPEARQYDAQIQQKQAEIEMLKRQYLPQVSLYSYYNMYGSDINNWTKSVGNIAQRTVSLGLNVNLPIFDGFKNQASIQKAKLEQEKLRMQKEEKLAQLSHQVQLYQSQVEGQGVTLKTKATIINSTQDKLNLVERLSDKQIVDQGQLIKEHISRIQKQVDAEKVMIEQLSALKKLKILSEG
jgi:outer membrane protein TolC